MKNEKKKNEKKKKMKKKKMGKNMTKTQLKARLRV
jgi:hypothetical protein